MDPKTETEDEWFVECSDDEKYGPEKGIWEPDPKDIVALYEKISKGETLTLNWKLPPGGRRSPTPERDLSEHLAEEAKEEEKEEEKQAPTEFDFDDIMQDANPITPKRTPGASKTSRSAQKRVATLEKIMGDMRRHKKLNTPRADPAAAAAAAVPQPSPAREGSPPPAAPPPTLNLDQTPTGPPAAAADTSPSAS